MDLGPHAAFILASYAAVISIVIGLAVWLWLDGRRYRHALTELEARAPRTAKQDVSD